MVSQLGRPFGGSFPPLEARMPPSGTMRASPQGEGFQVSFSLGIWALCLKCMVSVFSNRDLASASGGSLR